MANITGYGATITFGTSSPTFEIVSLDISMAREAVETTKLNATNPSREFITGLRSFTVSAEVLLPDVDYNTALTRPIEQVSETITITFPKFAPASASGAIFSFSGFITSFDVNASNDNPLSGSIEIQGTGDISYTDEV